MTQEELTLRQEDERALEWLNGDRGYCRNRHCASHRPDFHNLPVLWDVTSGLVFCENCGEIHRDGQESVTLFLFRQYSKKSSIQLTVRVTQEMKDAIKKIAEESISEAMEQAKAAR